MVRIFPATRVRMCPIILGEGQMLKDFEQALLGRSTGDEHTFSLTFP